MQTASIDRPVIGCFFLILCRYFCLVLKLNFTQLRLCSLYDYLRSWLCSACTGVIGGIKLNLRIMYCFYYILAKLCYWHNASYVVHKFILQRGGRYHCGLHVCGAQLEPIFTAKFLLISFLFRSFVKCLSYNVYARVTASASWAARWVDGLMEGRWIDEYMCWWVDGCTHERMHAWLDGYVSGWCLDLLGVCRIGSCR